MPNANERKSKFFTFTRKQKFKFYLPLSKLNDSVAKSGYSYKDLTETTEYKWRRMRYKMPHGNPFLRHLNLILQLHGMRLPEIILKSKDDVKVGNNV